jgi:hypothetical protein
MPMRVPRPVADARDHKKTTHAGEEKLTRQGKEKYQYNNRATATMGS